MSVDELHEGPLVPITGAPDGKAAAKASLTWREQRRRRRRRRRIGEEVLGWILVPAILVAGYFTALAGLSALGTSPSALLEQAKLVKQAVEKKGGL